jgi:hypothetical protein
MNQRLALLIILFCILSNTKIYSQIYKLDADSLIENIEKYNDKNVVVEGVIIHICGVDGKKMKLKTDKGEIIKIAPKDSLNSFDNSFYKKRIRVLGIVKESHIDNSYIDKIEKGKNILCHIDNTPCKDSAWINNKKQSGTADAISKQNIEKLRFKMKETGKNFIPTITIFAEKIEIIEGIK